MNLFNWIVAWCRGGTMASEIGAVQPPEFPRPLRLGIARMAGADRDSFVFGIPLSSGGMRVFYFFEMGPFVFNGKKVEHDDDGEICVRQVHQELLTGLRWIDPESFQDEQGASMIFISGER